MGWYMGMCYPPEGDQISLFRVCHSLFFNQTYIMGSSLSLSHSLSLLNLHSLLLFQILSLFSFSFPQIHLSFYQWIGIRTNNKWSQKMKYFSLDFTPWGAAHQVPGINFINVLRAAFAPPVDPKSVKRYWQLDWILTLLGVTGVKAVHKYVGEIEPWPLPRRGFILDRWLGSNWTTPLLPDPSENYFQTAFFVIFPLPRKYFKLRPCILTRLVPVNSSIEINRDNNRYF